MPVGSTAAAAAPPIARADAPRRPPPLHAPLPGRRGPARAACGSGAAARILPPCDYAPSNPKWLVAVADADPAALPPVPQAPVLDAFESATAAAGAPLELGGPEATALFALDPEWTYLNHGSYGAAFK